jgi:FkbM family methyltransferase
MSSWTISLFREWMPYMPLSSILRLRNCLLHGHEASATAEGIVSLEMKRPLAQSLTMRKVGSDFHTFEEIFVHKVYRELTHILPQCETVMDLGANIGLASLYFALSFPHARVFAVEPDAANFRLLTSNLEALNRVGRATAVQAGVWNADCDLEIDAPEETGAFNAVKVQTKSGAKATQTVCGMTMNSLLALSKFERIDLLKIDIEGAEVPLLQGDVDWLKRVECLAIEFHDDSRKVTRFDELMQRYGFAILSENDHTVVAQKK